MDELALGAPSGLVPDLAGPKIYTVAELVKSYLSAAREAAAAGPGAHSRPGRQGAPGRGEPGPGSRCRQADMGGIPGRPDLGHLRCPSSGRQRLSCMTPRGLPATA